MRRAGPKGEPASSPELLGRARAVRVLGDDEEGEGEREGEGPRRLLESGSTGVGIKKTYHGNRRLDKSLPPSAPRSPSALPDSGDDDCSLFGKQERCGSINSDRARVHGL